MSRVSSCCRVVLVSALVLVAMLGVARVADAQIPLLPDVILEVHPNERAPGPVLPLPMVGTAPWTPSGAGPGNFYKWKLYQFYAYGDLWVQICGQAWSASQNYPLGADKIQAEFDGVKLADWWGIQSGPRHQWEGNVDAGRRLTLEFAWTGLAPGVHNIKVKADQTPVIWWIKVTSLTERYPEEPQ